MLRRNKKITRLNQKKTFAQEMKEQLVYGSLFCGVAGGLVWFFIEQLLSKLS